MLIEEMKSSLEQYSSRAREVAVWVSMQMTLNPLLENLLLLDRFLYLEEQNEKEEEEEEEENKVEEEEKEEKRTSEVAEIRAELLPIFEVVFSPRNVALVAHKYRKEKK